MAHDIEEAVWQEVAGLLRQPDRLLQLGAAADAPKAGLSQETIRRAATQVESELDALCQHRARLQAWTEQKAAQSERMVSSAKLAEVAHKRLDTMSPVER